MKRARIEARKQFAADLAHSDAIRRGEHDEPYGPLTPLQRRAARARTAIRDGADPLLALGMVCWPPPEYEDAETARMLASRQVA